MAKIKKISINAFDKVKAECYTPTKVIEWHGIEVTIKPTLSLVDMLEFVTSVTQSCFDLNDAKFMPEFKDAAIRASILEKYTNFTLPTNIEHQYELLYCTDAIDTVLQHVNHNQFNEMINAIDDKISHLAQSNIEAIHAQMTELYSAFGNLQKNFENIFAGINPDDLSGLLKSLNNEQITEEGIVKAYMNQSKPGVNDDSN